MSLFITLVAYSFSLLYYFDIYFLFPNGQHNFDTNRHLWILLTLLGTIKHCYLAHFDLCKSIRYVEWRLRFSGKINKETSNGVVELGSRLSQNGDFNENIFLWTDLFVESMSS